MSKTHLFTLPQRLQAAKQERPIAAPLCRPFERRLAFGSIVLAAVLSSIFIAREFLWGNFGLQLMSSLAATGIASTIVACFAIQREDATYAPRWERSILLLFLAAVVAVPFLVKWANNQELGLSPAVLPALALFTAMVAPFAVSNQLAFGFGSLLPKCLIVAAAMRFETDGDLGFFSAGWLTSPSSAILAVTCYSVLASLVLLPYKNTRPPMLLMGLGISLTLPSIVLLDKVLVHFHLA